MTYTDPAKRAARVRELFLAEQQKMPTVDANGTPIPPAVTEPAPPAGLPAPNPALGSSASGPPDDTAQEMAEAKQRGDWKRILELLRDGLSPTDAA